MSDRRATASAEGAGDADRDMLAAVIGVGKNCTVCDWPLEEMGSLGRNVMVIAAYLFLRAPPQPVRPGSPPRLARAATPPRMTLARRQRCSARSPRTGLRSGTHPRFSAPDAIRNGL